LARFFIDIPWHWRGLTKAQALVIQTATQDDLEQPKGIHEISISNMYHGRITYTCY
jgi:hypothetical protein